MLFIYGNQGNGDPDPGGSALNGAPLTAPPRSQSWLFPVPGPPPQAWDRSLGAHLLQRFRGSRNPAPPACRAGLEPLQPLL